jgi:hypothetical protein
LINPVEKVAPLSGGGNLNPLLMTSSSVFPPQSSDASIHDERVKISYHFNKQAYGASILKL